MCIDKICDFVENMSMNKIRGFVRALFSIIFHFLVLIAITYQVVYFGLCLIEVLYNLVSDKSIYITLRADWYTRNLVISFFIICLYFYINIKEDMNKNRKP